MASSPPNFRKMFISIFVKREDFLIAGDVLDKVFDDIEDHFYLE